MKNKMDSVRSDDFAGLLAALGKGLNQPPQTLPPVQMPVMPMQMPQYIWQPVQQPPVVEKSSNTWIIVLAACAVLIFGVLIWMRSAKLQDPEEVSTIPPPSAVTNMYEEWPTKEEEVDKVAESLLNFVKEKKDVSEIVDLNTLDIPVEERKYSNKRISADESNEVLEYAKKREALFKDETFQEFS